MSPPIKSKPSTPNPIRQSGVPNDAGRRWFEPTLNEHRLPEEDHAFLLRLADRLGEELPLDEAVTAALSALAARLPNCRVELREPQSDSMEPASAASGPGLDPNPYSGFPSSTQLLERCSWPLSDAPDAKRLVIVLPEQRCTRDVSMALDLGAYVAQWLRVAARTDQLRTRLAERTDELLAVRRRVIQAEKLASYGQLVASSLHDLNNPLTAVIAYADYLARKSAQGGELDMGDRERLDRIREAAQLVLRQTRRLVEYACPARSSFDLVDVSEVIRRALALCEHEFAKAKLAVRLNLSDSMPHLSGHAEQLTQLFVNLFTNAAQAARPTEAHLVIEACELQPDARLAIMVRDNGSGISPSDIEHVFDAFYTTKSGSGCGLGLAIVRDIVEHHGARITVVSTPKEETTFTIVFPTAQTR